MRRLIHRLSAAAAISLALCAVGSSAAFGQFSLGLEDPGFGLPSTSASARTAFGTLAAAHVSTIRVTVDWNEVAPAGTQMPSGFDPLNPGDPDYNWAATDAAVRAAVQHGARVLITLNGAPRWAQPGGEPPDLALYNGFWNPNAAEFGAFAHAVALRYSGHFADPLHPGSKLPAVRMWEVWNEENLPKELTSLDPVNEYRSLLNAAYDAIKKVSPESTVAIGGLGPIGIKGAVVAPLEFAAKLLCLRRVRTHFVRAASCPVKAHFDVLAMHPYSLDVTPTLHAYSYDDVLVGDMGKLATLLRAAEQLHTAAPSIRYGLWVTEWSWFTNPPDPEVGDPEPAAARYTAYSMYEMWRAGVSLLVWFLVRDIPAPPTSQNLIGGGGLYTATGKPKLMLRAFEFPVVAGSGFVWGRAPVSSPSEVYVQRRAAKGWQEIAKVRTAADGVFLVNFRSHADADYRAKLAHGGVSLAYYSAPIPARQTHAGSPG